MSQSFRERVYDGPWPAATVLNTLLESEDIQTVVSREHRGTQYTIFVLNEAQIVRARDIVEHFMNGEPLVDPKTHRSWRCRGCNELIEGQFEICWKCGAAK